MKSKIILIIGFFLMNFSITCNSSVGNELPRTDKGTNPDHAINIQSSQDLLILTTKWASEFTYLHPAIKVSVTGIKASEVVDLTGQEGNLFFLSNDYYSRIKNESLWNMVVGRDAIVPVINMQNPMLEEINKYGISSEGFFRLFSNPENKEWGILLGNTQKLPVHYYQINDPSIKSVIGDFMNIDPDVIGGITSESVGQMISTVQKDPYGLAFCRLTDILNPDKKGFIDNLTILPIDKNGNGRLDRFEMIYSDLNTFMRGVWVGKYPSSLCRNIYSVSSKTPANKNEIAFLKWVLTDGQQYLNQNGYFDLVYSERQAKVDLLTDNKIYLSSSDENSPFKKTLITLIVIGVIAFLAVMFLRFFKNRKETKPEKIADTTSVFDENSVLLPKGLYFDKSHTWAFMEKNGTVRIGIDDFLQHVTGPVTRIKMKTRGEKITKGDPLLSIIQNGKQLTIYAPVSGTIISYNETLNTESTMINSSPYSDGWIYMIDPSNWLREIQFMIRGDKFSAWLSSEFSRLKDFFASSAMVGPLEYSHVVLQDGGVLKDNLLSDFGPEVWEEFQTKFIDSSK